MLFNQHPNNHLEQGIVDEVFASYKECRVKLHGVYWHAISQGDFDLVPGDYVQVVGRQNLKLVITPL